MSKETYKSLKSPKKYLHLDKMPRSKKQRKSWVGSFNKFSYSSYTFLPLIKHKIVERVWNYETDNFCFEPEKGKAKQREIFNSAHYDSAIYEFYAKKLSARYKGKLNNLELSGNITAYIPASPDEYGKNNIHYAKEVIDEISSRKKCTALVWDITNFFNCIDHQHLRNIFEEHFFYKKQHKILKDKKFNTDYSNLFDYIYELLTKYKYFENQDVAPFLKKEGLFPNISYYSVDQYYDESGKSKDSVLERMEQLSNEMHTKFKHLMKQNEKDYGIAQGNALSNILSNISMLEFDLEVKTICDEHKVFYRRYCDDLLFVGDDKHIKYLKQNLPHILKKSGKQLKLSDSKMSVTKFYKKPNAKIKATGDVFNYLGLSYTGAEVSISKKSVHRHLSRIYYDIHSSYLKVAYAEFLKSNPATIADFDKGFGKFFSKAYLKYCYAYKHGKEIPNAEKSQFIQYLRQADEIFKNKSPASFFRKVPNFKKFIDYHYKIAFKKQRNRFLKDIDG